MNIERLTANERRQLENLLRQTHDIRQYRRALAVLESGGGKPVAGIAQMLRVSPPSVYNWIAKFRRTRDVQELADAPRSGRPALWSGQTAARLQTLLQGSPQQLGYLATQWTVPLLREQLWHDPSEHFSAQTVRRGLHRLG
jgi:transposase